MNPPEGSILILGGDMPEKTVIAVYDKKAGGVTVTVCAKGKTTLITYDDQKKQIAVNGRGIKNPHERTLRKLQEIFLTLATTDI